jgi:hypothetical protein
MREVLSGRTLPHADATAGGFIQRNHKPAGSFFIDFSMEQRRMVL